MILPSDCWMKKTCARATNPNVEAPCNCGDTFCIKLFKLNYLFNEALISTKQREHVCMRLDEDMSDEQAFQELTKIQNNIKEFVSEGHNLYIYSNITGNGKTAWSLRLMQKYFETIWAETNLECKGLFVSVPKLLLSIKSSYSEENPYADHILKNILNADLVVWDEVGVKALSEHDHEQLLNLINSRIEQNKSNIYTSNLSPQDIREKIGDRLYSRIVNYSTTIQLRGADKRELFK